MNKGQKMGQSAGKTLLQMNEKLKEEIKKINQEWEMEVDECRAIYFRRLEDIKKLEEENKYLKETLTEESGNWSYQVKLLEEENKKLKEHNKTLEDLHNIEMKNMKMMADKWRYEVDKNKKLKEENKKLKE